MSDPSDLSFWFGGDATKGLNPQGQYGQQLGGYLQNAIQNQNGPGLNFGQANQAYGQMNGLAGQLGAISSGQQQGAGELAVQRQMANATAAQQAAARMARGSNAALAARDAARNTAQLGVTGAGQSQQAALGDQQAARSQLAQLLGQMQGGALQQQQLGLQGYQAQNQIHQGYLNQLLELNQQQFGNQLGINTLGMQDKGVTPYLLQGGGAIGAAYVGK